MKKIFLFIAILVASFVYCYAQYTKTNDFSESDMKKYFKENVASLDPIEGIYNVRLSRKSVYSNGELYDDDFSYRCAIVRIDDNKYKIFDETVIKSYGSATMHSELTLMTRIGETSAYSVDLKYTPIHSDEQLVSVNSRIVLESLLQFEMSVKIYYPIPRRYVDLDVYDDYNFIKEYPTSSMYEKAFAKHEEESKAREWTGTGYAVGNGYVVTNNHVADGAKSITLKGVKGDMNKGYCAEVVATDKTNDIAILKITDSRFNGFGAIPYSVSSRMADVGEDVFVLGYPLTQALGNEIKLTNGIISSRTGYQGDVATYQMSAPVQPGNSGGPMFDSKGNVIGIVVAGVPGAENVGYAIKTSYLKNLIESAGVNIKLPANNTVAGLSLAEKVKRVKNFVFYIECSK